MGDTDVAVGALFFVHLHTEDGELVKQAVQRAQGADETAEQTENEHAAHNDGDHQHELPGKQVVQHGEEDAFVGLVGQQQQAAFDGTGGADVLTEAGERLVAESVHQGYDTHEEYQNRILKEGKNAGSGALANLGGLDLVQQFLDQTEGAQPAADHTAKQNSVQKQGAADIEQGAAVCAEGTLQAA